MTEPNPSPPAPAPAPAATEPAPPVAATRPDYVPESFWDGDAKAVKPEFGQHYSELATFKQQHDERIAALPQKPEDYRIEVKLPETVKVPDGLELKVDDKHPLAAPVRAFALKHQLPQDALNELIAMHAQGEIESHNAEVARIAAEDAKLGANAKERKAAVNTWLTGLKTNNKITAAEHEAMQAYAVDAATVSALEKIIAIANGSVPASGGNAPTPPKPADVPMERRWYSQQQKVS